MKKNNIINKSKNHLVIKEDTTIINELNEDLVIDVYKNSKVFFRQLLINDSINLVVNLLEEDASFDGDFLILSNNKNNIKINQTINHLNKRTESTISSVCLSFDNATIDVKTTGIIKQGNIKSILKQNTKGIMLSNSSTIKSMPILLIDEYDVVANHGLSIGRLSDDELFYLMSRGISKDDALKMMLSGIINKFLDNEIFNEDLISKYKENINKLIKE